MERYGPGLVTVDRPPGRLAGRTRQLLWGTFHFISLRKMTRQNGSQLVSVLVLMFPAEIRGQDVKLSVNLRVNLSPLTSLFKPILEYQITRFIFAVAVLNI